MAKASYEFWRGDFRKITAEEIEDESIDLVFTDPPYGGQYLELWKPLANLAERVLKPGGLLVTYTGQYHLPRVLERLTEHLKFVWVDAIFTPKSNALLRPVRVKSRWKPMLILVKGKYDITCTPECKQLAEDGGCRVATGRVRKDKPVLETNFEHCQHTCRRVHDTRWWRFDTLTSEPPDKSQHPEGWTQSVAEAEYYIEKFTEAGDTVLDPMVGTGTTMLAALGLGRNAIGVDIDKELIDTVALPRVREAHPC